MPTSCKDAIKNWEAKNDEPAADAKIVKLYAQVPPIDKMDESLNQLEA
jgi:dynein light chain 1